VVGPTQASNANLIAPAPTWAERVYDSSYSDAEIAFMTLSCLFIALSVAFMIVVLALRNTSLIAASMPPFLLFILLGSIFVYLSVLLWPYHQLTTIGCHLRVWFINIGFVLVFGCLIAKKLPGVVPLAQ